MFFIKLASATVMADDYGMQYLIRHLTGKQTLVVMALATIIAIALALRLNNVSDYKFYPDSYQNLIVAQNLADYGQVLGFLGPNGMVYPDFLGWTRPGYSLLILIPGLFGLGLATSAQLVAFLCGVLAVPATYLMVKKVLNSRKAGLIGAAIMAISANHTAWSGFVLTESTGVLALLLFLWCYFGLLDLRKTSRSTEPSRGDEQVILSDGGVAIATSRAEKLLDRSSGESEGAGILRKSSLTKPENLPKWGWKTFISGGLLGIAILTRYEYVAVLIPTAWLLLQRSGGWRQLVNLLAGMSIVLAPCLWLYQGVLQNVPRIVEELSPLAVVVIAAGLGIFALWILFFRVRPKISNYYPYALIAIIWLVAAIVIIKAVFDLQPPGIELTAWADFFALDFTLGIFALVGLTLMLRRQAYFNLALFLIINIVLLAAIYYRVNPAMQRYITHELPFLIIPAAYGALTAMRWSLTQVKSLDGKVDIRRFVGSRESRTITIGILMALFTAQAAVSYRGIHEWSNGIWFQTGYEERVARHLAPQLPTDTVLIASLPEPYYLFTGRSTHSLAPEYPYLYMPNVSPGSNLVIVQDEGTRRLFPEFSQVLDQRMQSYKTGEFWAGVPFRYQADIHPEFQPVKVYQLKLDVLKNEISKSEPINQAY